MSDVTGRPRKPDAERRTTHVNVRFTADEADALYREALRRRIPLAQLIRMVALSVVSKAQMAESGPNLGGV